MRDALPIFKAKGANVIGPYGRRGWGAMGAERPGGLGICCYVLRCYFVFNVSESFQTIKMRFLIFSPSLASMSKLKIWKQIDIFYVFYDYYETK